MLYLSSTAAAIATAAGTAPACSGTGPCQSQKHYIYLALHLSASFFRAQLLQRCEPGTKIVSLLMPQTLTFKTLTGRVNDKPLLK